MTQKKTDTEILNEVLRIVKDLSGDVRCYDEDFNPDDYAGGNIDDAWDGGFNDGVSGTANDILAIIQQGRGE